MLLSVLVISHNQKAQVKRCLDSIISQNIPFEYEIVVSDDSSTDGTWELECEYSRKYPFVKVFQCSSDDCQPLATTERSGYNRSNAYNHSSGKYFVHIDGDDYYRPGTDCLMRQVELLEEHPECSMCMQNDWSVIEGETLENGRCTHPLHKYETGRIVTAEEYFRDNLFINNAVMMMRRNDIVNPAYLYQKWYVDSIITEHHLQCGPIVCLDRNDWIYVHYPNTITSSMKANDQSIMWPLDLTVFAAAMVPTFKALYYFNEDALKSLLDAVRLVLRKVAVSDDVRAFFGQFKKIFLFKVAATDRLTLLERARLLLIREYIKHLLKTGDKSESSMLRLNSLCGGNNLIVKP